MGGLPIGPLELVIILVIALLVLGPGKLPEVGSAFGKTIREFRKASSDIQESTALTPAPATRDAAAARPVSASPAAAPPVAEPPVAEPPVAEPPVAEPITSAVTAEPPRGTPPDAVDDAS